MSKKLFFFILFILLPLFSIGIPVTSAKEPKVIILRAADFYPPGHPLRKGFLNGWVKMFEERTKAIGHPVKIQYYGQSSLVKAADLVDAARTGICDMANATYIGKYMPMIYFTQIPGMVPDDDVVKAVPADVELNRKVMDPFYEKLGLKRIFTMGGGTTQYQLAGKGKPPTTLADLKGLTVRVAGKLLPLSAKALGMTPVSMTMGEVYEALDRGLINTVSLQVGSYTDYAFFETIDWAIVNLNLGQYGLTSWVMNLRKYNSLPDEVKQVIKDIEIPAAEYLEQTNYDTLKRDLTQVWPKKGVKLVYLSKKDIERKNEILAPVARTWLKEMENKGYPMKRMMTVWQNAVAKQGITLPEGINPWK